GTIDGANVLSFSVTNASLFVGSGGAFNAARDSIITTNAVGFSVGSATFTFASVSKLTESFTAVSVSVTNAGFVGVDGFEIWVSGTVNLNSTSRIDGQRVDWDSATTVPSTGTNLLAGIAIDQAVELQVVSASAAVNVFGFFVATVGPNNFTLTRATANVVTGNAALGTLTGASVFSISLDGLNAFAGVGASLSGSSSSA
ncbi:unnamed protein product, partial [Phaeothamnion confervicola]